MTPEITIVTPAYNAALYIADCIISVQQQTFALWEMIIVNDGSTDNTAEIVTGFLNDTRIKLITQPNKGVSAARNTGIKAAKGKYIAFLDADDYLLKDNLQVKYTALNKDASIDFVYSDIWKCDEKLNDLYIEKGVEPSELFIKVMEWKQETIPGLSSNLMIRTSSVNTLNLLFNENLSNCADRYMKILLSSRAKGIYIPQPLIKYRNVPGSMSKKVVLLEHDEEYIITKIKEENILPGGAFRRKIIANIYFTLSGSWYKDAHNPARAIKYAFKAIFTYPPSFFRLLIKGPRIISPKK